MRYYRRGHHVPKKDVLTVDKVLCAVLPPGHVTANQKYLCFHNMTISIPELPPEQKAFVMIEPSDGTVVLDTAGLEGRS